MQPPGGVNGGIVEQWMPAACLQPGGDDRARSIQKQQHERLTFEPACDRLGRIEQLPGQLSVCLPRRRTIQKRRQAFAGSGRRGIGRLGDLG